MKSIISFLTFYSIAFSAISQDTLTKLNKEVKTHRLSFSINTLPLLINERSIYIDYCYKERHAVGISIGQIYANPQLYVNFLSLDQGRNPGTVWNGIVTRIGYKYYFTYGRRHYVEAEVLFKSLGYSNKEFINMQGGEDHMNTFYRSENANVYGANMLFGTHLTSIKKLVNIEFFIGIGLRERIRNYTTLSSAIEGVSFKNPQPIGSFKLKQEYPMVTIGLKIGINTFFK